VQTESDAYGTGAKVWPASLVLIKYLEWTRDKWLLSTSSLGGLEEEDVNRVGGVWSKKKRRRRTVVDLGAGTGVTSLGIALMLASSPTPNHENGIEEDEPSLVVCTDGCGLVVNLAEENVRRVVHELTVGISDGTEDDTTALKSKNEGSNTTDTTRNTSSNHPIEHMIGTCEIRVKEYNWGDGTLNNELAGTDNCNGNTNDDATANNNNHHHHHYDIILVSDCVLPKLYPIAPLVDALDELSGPESVAYISYEERYYPEYDPKEYFRTLAEGKGLEVTVVPLEEQHPIYSVEDIEIWEVRRRKEE